jgi:argininosuccinate lyase
MTGMVGDLTVRRERMRAAPAPATPPPPTSPTGWCACRTCRSARPTTSPAGSSVDERIDSRIHKVLGVENSVRSRTSYGGTAPDNVLPRWPAGGKR